jgi:hypothetical protein
MLKRVSRFRDEPAQRGQSPQPVRAVIWKLSEMEIHEPILVSNREVQSGKWR